MSGPPFVECAPLAFSPLQNVKCIAIKLLAQIER